MTLLTQVGAPVAGLGQAGGRPADDILLALRGTAYLLRWLALLAEDEFDAVGSELAPESRRQSIARVGYEARLFAGLAEELRVAAEPPRAPLLTSDEVPPDISTPEDFEEQVALGATLPARALRYLVEHSAVHLSVEWRDLPDRLWSVAGTDLAGAPITPVDTAWLRAKRVWLAAVDLGNGGSFADLPPVLLDRLVREAVADRGARGEDARVELSATGAVVTLGNAPGGAVQTVSGSLSDVARWLTGRGERRLAVAPAAGVGGAD